MTKSATLRTTAETLRMLERGLKGYALVNDSPCYLLLSDGNTLKVSVSRADIPRGSSASPLLWYESEAPEGTRIPFVARRGGTATSVLLREEYIEPFTGDPTGLVGQPPTNVQKAAKPGQVPGQALESCVVAYGLLIRANNQRLVVAADWFPYELDVTLEEARIGAHLAVSEIVPLTQYVRQFGSVS